MALTIIEIASSSDDKSGADITIRIESDKLYVTVDGRECPIDKALLG
jgi:hypothetical protein